MEHAKLTTQRTAVDYFITQNNFVRNKQKKAVELTFTVRKLLNWKVTNEQRKQKLPISSSLHMKILFATKKNALFVCGNK